MQPADAILEKVREVRSQFLQYDWSNRFALVANLTASYHQMVASENLIRVAIKESKSDWLTEYLERHLVEEADHAKWMARDLLEAGVVVDQTTIPVHVVEMVGSIYYLIYHKDPLALLGYMLVMESAPPPKQLIEALEMVHGKPLLRTVRFHAEHDPDHTDELKAIINSVPEEDRYIISQTAIQTAHYLGRISADLHKYTNN